MCERDIKTSSKRSAEVNSFLFALAPFLPATIPEADLLSLLSDAGGARARRRRDSSSRPCSSAVLLVRFSSALLVDSGPTPTEPPRPVSVLTAPVSPLRPSPCSSREALRYSVAGSDEQTDSVILLLGPCSVVVLSFLSRVNLFSVRSLKSNPRSMVTEDFVGSLKNSLRSMVKEGFPFHTSPAKNILIERYVSNPALRALISLQDLFETAKILVEERIVAILVSLQYSTNQSFEDRLLLVNVLVVTGLDKVQLSLRQDKSVFTAKPCVRYLLLLHTFTSMPQLLRFINFYVSWPTTTLSHTGRGEMALTSIPCSLVSTPYMESEKIFVPIVSAPFSLNNMLFQTYEIHLVFLESIVGRSPDAPFLRLQCYRNVYGRSGDSTFDGASSRSSAASTSADDFDGNSGGADGNAYSLSHLPSSSFFLRHYVSRHVMYDSETMCRLIQITHALMV
ncbi:hypothetical protein DY000_02035773 [Brassica cretica]|uniref:Uncharacterized protein n=1 Tax=Brassica cretica TaxID=69181 RepID=A0ABQ7DNX1_BRACR|nr:hypothetical protein DY000_02035773 [Brassica cretica]